MEKTEFFDIYRLVIREFISLFHTFATVVGNLILFLIFSEYLLIGNKFFIIGLLVSFVLFGKINQWKKYVFLCVPIVLIANMMHPQIVYYILGTIVVLVAVGYVWLNKNAGSRFYEKFHLTWKVLFRASVALPRVFFMNVAHILFPQLLIWTAILYGAYHFQFVHFIRDSSGLLNLISAIGVLFGFFQYYQTRHEEKIVGKANQRFVRSLFSKDLFSFDEFKNYLEKATNINKGNILQVCRSLLNPKTTPTTSWFNSNRAGRTICNQYFISRNEHRLDNDMLYQLLEADCKRENQDKLLTSVYAGFFEQQKAVLLKSLENDEIDEIVWLFIENPTILEEVYASMSVSSIEVTEEPQTYAEFLLKTYHEVIEELTFTLATQ